MYEAPLFTLKQLTLGNPPVVQWLGLRAFTAEGAGSIPGQETKIPQAVWHGQKKKVYKCITQEQRNGKDP